MFLRSSTSFRSNETRLDVTWVRIVWLCIAKLCGVLSARARNREDGRDARLEFFEGIPSPVWRLAEPRQRQRSLCDSVVADNEPGTAVRRTLSLMEGDYEQNII